MRLDPKQLYTYLVQNGGTPNQAAMLTGMAGAESNYNPTLSHDGGTGYGLWGHRNERWRAMQQMAGARNPAWQQQALYALRELNDRSLPTYQGLAARALASARSPVEVTQAGMHFERPLGYTAANPAGGHNYSGRLALVSQAMNGTPHVSGSVTTPGSASTPVTPGVTSAVTPAGPPAPATPSPDPVPVDMLPPPPPEEMPDPYSPAVVADATESPGGMDMTDLHDLMQAADLAGFNEQPDPSSLAIHQKAAQGRQRMASMGDLQFDPYEPVVVGQASKMPQFRVTKNG